MPRADVVFLRNVLICFDIPTRRGSRQASARCFVPTGYLFLGGAETTMNLDESFERVQPDKTGCYRVRDAAERRPDMQPLEDQIAEITRMVFDTVLGLEAVPADLRVTDRGRPGHAGGRRPDHRGAFGHGDRVVHRRRSGPRGRDPVRRCPTAPRPSETRHAGELVNITGGNLKPLVLDRRAVAAADPGGTTGDGKLLGKVRFD